MLRLLTIMTITKTSEEIGLKLSRIKQCTITLY